MLRRVQHGRLMTSYMSLPCNRFALSEAQMRPRSIPLHLSTCSNTGNYSNYLDALMAVYDDAQARGIPYRAVLLDVS
jgi:hypothetical protein